MDDYGEFHLFCYSVQLSKIQHPSFGEIRQWICLKTGILEMPTSTICSIADLPGDVRQGIPSAEILEKDRQTFVRSVFAYLVLS